MRRYPAVVSDALRAWLGSLDGEDVSDLHLKPGSPPRLRRKRDLEPLNGAPALTRAEVDAIAEEILTTDAASAVRTGGEATCTLSVAGLGRYGVRAQRQRGSTLLVVRRIADSVPSLRELGLPAEVERLLDAERGIVLVGGPPRSGRRTTLASIVDHLNRTRAVHLVAVERPVDVLHRDVRASVSQLEVGVDTPTFGTGVRAAVAADGDAVAVSDVTEADTVEAILEAVEDGAFVVAGVEGDGAAQLLDRFVGLLPEPRRDSARLALSGALVGTVSQRLAQRAGNTGRVPVVEVMRATARVRATLVDDASIDEIGGLAEVRFTDSVVTLLEDGVLDLAGALAVIDDWPALHAAMQSRGFLDAESDVPAPALDEPEPLPPEPLPPLPRRNRSTS